MTNEEREDFWVAVGAALREQAVRNITEALCGLRTPFGSETGSTGYAIGSLVRSLRLFERAQRGLAAVRSLSPEKFEQLVAMVTTPQPSPGPFTSTRDAEEAQRWVDRFNALFPDFPEAHLPPPRVVEAVVEDVYEAAIAPTPGFQLANAVNEVMAGLSPEQIEGVVTQMRTDLAKRVQNLMATNESES